MLSVILPAVPNPITFEVAQKKNLGWFSANVIACVEISQ